jgi:hypothetical protein
VAGRVVGGTRVLRDSERTDLSALDWLGGVGVDAAGNAEGRAAALLAANAGVLRALGLEADLARVGGQPVIRVSAGTRVGAVPLLSPVSGRLDFGIVVRPRFDWDAVGQLLHAAGMRSVPEVLPFPTLPRSERSVPSWVIASMVLARLEALLRTQTRRFRQRDADLPAPRGTVDWGRYLTHGLGQCRPLNVPCRFPDLDDDERLRGAIHWTALRQREGLLGQRSVAPVARALLDRCEQILARVSGTGPLRPGRGARDAWASEPMRSRLFREGIEAIGWTVDERGLAGLSETAGLSWQLPMEACFEALIEAAAEMAAPRVGGRVTSGRTARTRTALDWEPRGAGSLRALVPDVLLRTPGASVILDAKYKPHAEMIARQGWDGVPEVIRERHRADVHQVLAYAALEGRERITACLAYPASPEGWSTLVDRGRETMRATIRAEGREVDLVLLAVKLDGDAAELARRVEGVVKAG